MVKGEENLQIIQHGLRVEGATWRAAMLAALLIYNHLFRWTRIFPHIIITPEIGAQTCRKPSTT